MTYHRGLALVMHSQALPVLLNLTFAIGDVSLEIDEPRDAEGFMGLAAQIADKMGNPFVQADALEKQGLARDCRGDLAGAVLVWQAAAALSKTCAYPERQQSVLARLIRAYKTLGQGDLRRACEAALRSPGGQTTRRAHGPRAFPGSCVMSAPSASGHGAAQAASSQAQPPQPLIAETDNPSLDVLVGDLNDAAAPSRTCSTRTRATCTRPTRSSAARSGPSRPR